jgi:hypothetical protein
VKNQWTALREKKGWAPSEFADSIGASTACNIAESLNANVTKSFSRVTRRARLEGLAVIPWYVRLFWGLTRVLPTKAQERASAEATPRPRPNLTAPRLLFPLNCASRLRHSPDSQVFATNDKRHGSGEPSGFAGFSLRAGRTRSCFLRHQMQTPPREGHQWSQIHSS